MTEQNRSTALRRMAPLAAAALGLALLFAAVVAYGVAETSTVPVALALVGVLALIAGVVADPAAARALAGSRTTKFGLLALYQSVLVLGILVCINIFAVKHPTTRDTTEGGLFTLADQTVKILENLKQPVKAVAFFKDETKGRMRDYLDEFERVSKGNFTFEFINPDKNPSIVKRYDVTQYDTTVLECAKNETKITEVSEEALSNALIKVTRSEKKKIYLLAGHGELERASQEANGFSAAAKGLEDDQYEVADLHLYREEKVPDDAAVVILAGPQKPLFDNEIASLRTWVAAGGSFVALVDPTVETKVEPLLEEWGITVGNDVVVDLNPVAKLLGAGEVMPVISSYGSHPITDKFTLATVFPYSRSVRKAATTPSGVTVNELALTTPQSWAEKDLDPAKGAQFTPGVDLKGPVSLAAAASKKVDAKEARVVVFGDSDFASNRYFGMQGNGNFLLNAVNWTAQEMDLVSIQPKTLKNTPLQITSKDASVLFYTCIVVFPVVFLAAGGAIWYVRRSL